MEDQAASRESLGVESASKFPPPRSSSSGHRIPEGEPAQRQWSGDYGLSAGDRRFAFSRQSSFRQSFHRSQSDPQTPVSSQGNHSFRPYLSRSDSSISIPPWEIDGYGVGYSKFSLKGDGEGHQKLTVLQLMLSLVGAIRSGNRPMKRLALMISLNVAYSTAELLIGVLTGRVGLVSDAFHLTFGCGLLTFSLFSMAASRRKPDEVYTYGYKRLEVLSAFTNALFLLFMSFSLAVEALHAFIQDESEHKHYLIVSAVTNLLVNLLGVWFFRAYARVNIVYRKAEDMNYHSVCLHVLSDSIRSAGLILASWFLTLGVENAEVLCLGLVSVAVFMVVLPLFKATGGILLQMAPANVSPSAFSKCWRQVTALEDVSEVSQARFWELVPGHAIGSLLIQVKRGANDGPILHYVHGLYHDLGVQDLTVQMEYT
ncbi:metal tolerance protein C2 [Elaeis guineensis]|uniref:Metal tolerance protein C2 n=2 Tax=Elaeis guineensis var. tenera TaxID=51953 RepID=A0A6I9RZT4_ELAGV|nr:metal tolerance protein C2 [Elaeis guineensis]